MQLYELIRAARRKAGLSQTKFAARIDVDPSSVSRWERDVTLPYRTQLAAIAAATKVPLARLESAYELAASRAF
jgi:transcriptional regulator with XRE-family HTH domain